MKILSGMFAAAVVVLAAAALVFTGKYNMRVMKYAASCGYDEERTIDLINQERSARGLCPVCGKSHLNNDSCCRAQEASIKFSHTRPDGTPYYTVDEANVYGEVLADGCSSPEEVVNEWMHSDSHRDIILNPAYRGAGVGTSNSGGRKFWAVEFGM